MNRQELRDALDNMPSPVAVFKVVKVPKEHNNRLYEGDVLYTTDGEEFWLSMHDFETANPMKHRDPLPPTGGEPPEGCPARENGWWNFEADNLEFVEYDYL